MREKFENQLSVEEHFGDGIKQLFGSLEYQCIPQLKRGFAVGKSIQKNTILFIGINPSYRKNDQAHKQSFWDPEQDCSDRYFKRFVKLSESCGHPWAHMDLLPIRETSQKELEKLEKDHLDFLMKNLMISKEILEAHEPKLVVVANTLARKYLGKQQKNGKNVWMDYDFGKMREDGTYRIQNEDSKLKGVPFFFSGMLTGQRALDNGSFERLKWHVKMVLNKEIASNTQSMI